MTTFTPSLIKRIEANPNPRTLRGRVRMARNWFHHLDSEKAWEAARTTFGIFGAMGFAGFLASMHWFLGGVSLAMAGGTWYGVYRMIDK